MLVNNIRHINLTDFPALKITSVTETFHRSSGIQIGQNKCI